jgi:hypothetical protein
VNVVTGEDRVRQALWRSIAVIGVITVIVLAVIYWPEGSDRVTSISDYQSSGPRPARTAPLEIPGLKFTDITLAAGIDFVHRTGAYGERLLPETMGGGVAFLDYNDDDHQDILLINSTQWPWQPETVDRPTTRLYRGRGDATFEDVSESVGLDLTLYGMGAAVGDYDGDGRVDIFITALGENRLLRNVDGKGFVDVTLAAGVAGDAQAWSTSAAFFDYDRDGDLDLFVCNYVGWSRELDGKVNYQLTGIGRAYGPPTDFAGTDSYLYRNDHSVFTDVSMEAGIRVAQANGDPIGKALAVHPTDVNGDGWLDLVVANDTVRNFLFVNQRNGRFVESGIHYGLAYDTGGLATGAMGIDAAHFANDERVAIAIGNFANEMSSFYVSRSPDPYFTDDAIVAGIGANSRQVLTFGLAFIDMDLDGRLDLVTANGHVEPEINRVQSSQHFAQPLQLFWNCGPQCTRPYQLVSLNGEGQGTRLVGRGATYADIDGDGDQDLLITQAGGRPVLLRNDHLAGNNWLTVRLRSNPPNVHAIGASVTLRASGSRQQRAVMTARSYLSQTALPLSFGLGAASRVDDVTVVWPDGTLESWQNLDVNQILVLRQGFEQK